ncbi:LysR family transcriptional regulator [Aestuariibacter salexigens]|uniref:LysR family transcriptional regulator n=1 Tax=Aestuariibacter salexigens TaxID=226010 RepID=UPI0004230C1F|nr:LysR family transcriptional regulator [Aestuariibacter salexigens]
MDIRFLRTFVEVAETRHFGKAAENLYLTQSAVSARIKQLEEYFNMPLFMRFRHSIKLTPAGEKLLPYAHQMITLLGEARHALNEDDVQHLVIAGTPNAWELYLQQGLSVLSAQFPQLSLRAEVLNNDHLSRQLHERTVDLAVSIEPLKSEDVEKVQLCEMPLALYTNCEGDVSEHYVHIDWGGKVNTAVEQAVTYAKRAHLRTGSVLVAIQYIQRNGGAAVLPTDLGARLGLQKVLPLDHVTLPIFLFYLHDAKQLGLQEFIARLNTIEGNVS